MTRLNPTNATKRRLYLLSGNECAFPTCNQRLTDENGDFIGEICHIEGANEGGERYNPFQTDEERRDISNLILLCPNHHKITDNEEIYTVEYLKEIKRNHESNFFTPIMMMCLVITYIKKQYTHKIYLKLLKIVNPIKTTFQIF